jgi:hypothetical protein
VETREINYTDTLKMNEHSELEVIDEIFSGEISRLEEKMIKIKIIILAVVIIFMISIVGLVTFSNQQKAVGSPTVFYSCIISVLAVVGYTRMKLLNQIRSIVNKTQARWVAAKKTAEAFRLKNVDVFVFIRNPNGKQGFDWADEMEQMVLVTTAWAAPGGVNLPAIMLNRKNSSNWICVADFVSAEREWEYMESTKH